jgi:hypothetical protein
MRRQPFPSSAQLQRLARESEIVVEPLRMRRALHDITIDVTLPPQGVAAIDVKPSRAEGH